MRYFEDFQVEDTFNLGSLRVTEEEIIDFARQFDPQPFHIDPERAKDSIFGGLVASGWHITAMYMRLLFNGLIHETASMGSPGVEDVRWLKPVRPGDLLQASFTVLDSTPSSSRPNMGIMRSACELFNQSGELVMSMKGVHFVGRRPASATNDK